MNENYTNYKKPSELPPPRIEIVETGPLQVPQQHRAAIAETIKYAFTTTLPTLLQSVKSLAEKTVSTYPQFDIRMFCKLLNNPITKIVINFIDVRTGRDIPLNRAQQLQDDGKIPCLVTNLTFFIN